MIALPQGGEFDEASLIDYLLGTARDYIIQGQQNSSLADHTKPDSLDYWLRLNGATSPDTKQAENEVVDALVATGLFEVSVDLQCPNSGTPCKGLRLVRP